MTQPTNYTPTTDFSQQESINASGRSTVNTSALDAEFANIETTLDQTVSNLSLIQRDDGRLKDVCVEIHTISPEVLNLIGGGYALRGLWAAATAYAVNDLCSNGAYTYVCRTAHTSGGAFDGQYWIQFGFTSGADAAAAAAAAQSSATNAAGSASTATTAATNAAGSASTATTAAMNAAGSASTASINASSALVSATSAANSAAAAEAAISAVVFPISVLNGGTGATSAEAARSALDVPSLSGSGAIGTWGISVSGNAATSTTSGSAVTAKNAAVDSDSGVFGYVNGSGGTVTQATSKGTTVTINKPCGQIATHNAVLAAGAAVTFVVLNSTVTLNDSVIVTPSATANYSAACIAATNGSFYIRLTNITAGSLPEAVNLNFAIIKGILS